MAQKDRSKEDLTEQIKLLQKRILELEKMNSERKQQQQQQQQQNVQIRRLATVVLDSNDAITIQDFDGRITAWNRGAELMYGYSEEEALKKSIDLLTHPDKVAEQKDFTRRLKEGEVITSFETQRVTKDGRILDVWLTVTKLVDVAGNPIGIASTERDITERKRAEGALKESEERLAAIFQNAQEGILIVDVETKKFVEANELMLKWLGYDEEEIRNMGVSDLQRPEDLAHALDSFEKLRKKEIIIAEDIPMKRKDGSVFYADITSATVAIGGKSYLTGFFRDITRRRVAEEALRYSEKRYRTLVENIPQKIFLKGKDLTYISCNENYARDLKIKPQEIIGKTDHDFYPGELAEKYRADDKKIMAAGKREDIDEKYIQDGREQWVHTIKTPVKDENDNIIGIFGIFWDITERRKLEDKIKESEINLARAQKMVHLGSWDWDIRRNQLKYSDEMYRIWGYEPLAFIPRYEDFIDTLHPEDKERVKQAVNEALEKGCPYYVDYRIKTRGGEERMISASGEAEFDQKGKPIRMFGTALDITERKAAEEKLSHFQKAVDSATDAIGMSTPQGRHYYQNEAFTKLFGLSVSETNGVSGPPATVYVDEKVGRKVFDTIMKGGSFIGEVKMLDKNRNEKDILQRAYSIKDKEGKVIGLVGMHTDITERKVAEKVLRTSEKRYRQLFEESNDAIFIADPETGVFIDCNKKAENLIGYSKSEILSMRAEQIHPEDRVEETMKGFKDQAAGIVKNVESEILRKDGKRVPVLINSTIMEIEGKPCLMGVFRDIAELKRAEEELIWNYDTQRIINTLLFQVTLDISMEKFLDRALELIFSMPWLSLQSRGAIFLVEDKPDTLVMKAEKRLSDDLKITCKNVPFGKCVCGRAASLKTAQFINTLDERHEIRYAAMSPHGHYCVPIMTRDKVLGVINVYVEENARHEEKVENFLITIANTLAETIERKRVEQELMESHRDLEQKVMERTAELMEANDQLERTTEELKRAVKARSDFLANMSHELRTPLNSINGFSEVLFDETFGPLNAKQKEYVDYILGSGKHLLSLINDVLDLAKVEAGKMELVISKFSIKRMLDDAVVMIREIAFGKDIKTSIEVGEGVVDIEADEIKIKQVLYNLLSNAVKFTSEGGKVGIRVDNIDGDIEVAIWDTGIGIAPEQIGKLFESFIRVEEPYVREIEGTGLGLALSKKFVEMHCHIIYCIL